MAEHANDLARKIRKEATRLGFAAIGFSAPVRQPLAMERYNSMITEKRHGEMAYMERRSDERAIPALLFSGLKTIISVAVSYNHIWPTSDEKLNISKYAVINDYHAAVRKKLQTLHESLKAIIGKDVEAAIYVDSAPVLEKNWAEQAGIGTTGKNTLLIVPSAGTYVFLGEMFINIEIIDQKAPLPNLCGSCNNCINSCPTGALLEPGKIDASKCISYLTVELKRDFTLEEASMIGTQLFGCDLCQEVCHHNNQKGGTGDMTFTVKKELLNITAEKIQSLTTSSFRTLFYGTPIFRIGLKRLKRNAHAIKENLQRLEDSPN